MNKFSVLTGIPDFTKGLVRELRVRWALEEMGLPHEEVRYPHPETKKEEYKKKQPFGQVPYLESGDFCMFETGAILIHLGLKHNKLLPTDERERAKVLTWMFAAINSVEPYLTHHFLLKIDPESTEAMRAKAREQIDGRLQVVSNELGNREFFGTNFSIADILMTTVLRNAIKVDTLEKYPNLLSYLERTQSRPAFQRALHDHESLYEEKK